MQSIYELHLQLRLTFWRGSKIPQLPQEIHSRQKISRHSDRVPGHGFEADPAVVVILPGFEVQDIQNGSSEEVPVILCRPGS